KNKHTTLGKSVEIKASKLKKKNQTLKRSKIIKKTKAKGKLTYSLDSVYKKKFKKYFKLNKKTGNLTIKKGLKKGEYELVFIIKSAGTSTYKSSKHKDFLMIIVK
ncbi:MAG: hypothetical protein K5639_06610, partial [Eubacterium sp.]|nr:hypothetical protein [Eubacterium sp.]